MSVRFLGVVAAMAAMGLVACGDDTGGAGGSGGAGSGGGATTGSAGGSTTGSTSGSTGSGGDDTTSATGTGGGEVGPCNDICNTTEEIPQSDECTDCGTTAALGGDCATEGTACLAAAEGEGDTAGCCPCGAFLQGACADGGFSEDLCGTSEGPYTDLTSCICDVCS